MKFADLALCAPLLSAVATQGYETATPIQIQAIPPVLAGQDLIGCAQTGTGKTAAFALPILHRLSTHPRPTSHPRPRPRALILCPTRELANQISQSFGEYGQNLSLHHTMIFGGVNQNPQVTALRRGVDIVIATPGRLLDLMDQGVADLRSIEVLVLDEADRMLDMGFINDIRRIAEVLPPERQTLMFSATMPREIRELAEALLKNPVNIQVAPTSATADNIEQAVYHVPRANKGALLAHLVDELAMHRAIVFTRTKRGADRLVRNLHARGIRAQAIHSNKNQNLRQRAMDQFQAGRIPVLVATDIASRGIDVDGITHVVNYDLTHEPETYIHRIGRTARAGASGMAISFCDPEEVPNLRAIERLIRRDIPVSSMEGFTLIAAPKPAAAQQARQSNQPNQNHPRARHSQQPRAHPQLRTDRSEVSFTGHPFQGAPAQRPRSSGGRPNRPMGKPHWKSKFGGKRKAYGPVRASSSGPRRAW